MLPQPSTFTPFPYTALPIFDVLARRCERARIAVGEILAKEACLPRIFREADRRVIGVVRRHRVAQPRRTGNQHAIARQQCERSEEHTSELQSREEVVSSLLL